MSNAGKLQVAEDLLIAGIITTPYEFLYILNSSTKTPIDLNGIFKEVYSEKLQELFNNAKHDALIYGEGKVDMEAFYGSIEKQCTCDLATVIMVTGCKCGGT